MPTLDDDYSFQFGDTGTILNTDEMGLPFIDVDQVTGLDTAPLRTMTDEHQGMDGTYIDTPFSSMRTVVVTGTLYTNPADPDSLLKSLRTDYASNVIRPFYFRLPGQPIQFVNGQGGGLQYNVDQNRRIGKTPVQFSVLAGDPYIYDYPANQSKVSLPTINDIGAGFPISFNLGFGGINLNNSASVTNSGTHPAYPVITLAGPLTNPVLVDANGITMSFSISLSAADKLVIDCRNRSVVLNGQVSRRNTLAGILWFSVQPLMQETIFFSADAGAGSATIVLYNTYY